MPMYSASLPPCLLKLYSLEKHILLFLCALLSAFLAINIGLKKHFIGFSWKIIFS